MANTITRYEARQYAIRIAAGRAYDEHVKGDKQFDHQLTRKEFAQLIDEAILNCMRSKALQRGRRGFWYAPKSLLVVLNPNDRDGGTAYVPDDLLTEFRDLR